jgi:DNA ligase-1
MIKKPLLAASLEDASTLTFPQYVTPKLDGIRCLKVDGKVVSRKFIEIPNHHIRNWIQANCPDGFDGEIIIPGKTFNETQSAVMCADGHPDFIYYVFDYVQDDLKKDYVDRCEDMCKWMEWAKDMTKLIVLLPTKIKTLDGLILYEKFAVLDGYEGIMLRKADSPYKCGRSTLKEGALLKWKRMEDSEAVVLGFEEQLENRNEKVRDNLGNAKRSSKKANLVPKDTLGCLLVRDIKTGVEFSVGTGFDDALRKEIWYNQDTYIGKMVTYQYQPHGMKDKPRCPSFKGFRDERDISE